jgi:hypothetical protein
MNENIPMLYTKAERRLLPIRDRIMDAIYNSPDDEITVSEIVGLLETIKFEIIMSEYNAVPE